MREIKLEELKEVQMGVLDIVHRFCIENNINYTLGCGTLLGAIRHKGYIPWDDDIDIYMLREEYDKLIKLFPKVYNDVAISSLERNDNWERAYAKAYNTRTMIEEKGEKDVIGVNIDIFPIDQVPQEEYKWKIFNNTRRFLHSLYDSKYETINKERKLYRNIVLIVFKVITLPFSAKQLCIFFNWFVRRYNSKESDYVFESCQGMLQKNRFKRSYMNQFVDLPFENRYYRCMKEYDAYLKCGFGDYLELPPIEKRVSHHLFKAWWKD